MQTDTLDRFKGEWTLTREIEDFRAGAIVQFQGTAEFRASEGGRLVMRESGWLTTPQGGRMRADRSYIWQQSAPGWIDVCFDDGRPFHGFDAGHIAPTALHKCPPDRYEVTYAFDDWPDWSMVWRVRGPRKDYRSVSRFARP